MHVDMQKYKLLKTTKIWNVPSDNEDKIIAPQSELEALKKNVKRPKANPTEKETASKKRTKDGRDNKDGFAENLAWIFKEPADLKKPECGMTRSGSGFTPKPLASTILERIVATPLTSAHEVPRRE